MRIGRSRRAACVAAWLALLSLPALSHHILGVPHYAYDEAYPQAPVITYSVEAGPYLIKVTGYPGRPTPGELTQIHAYVHLKDDASQVFGGPIEVRIERDGMLGPDVVWGPTSTRFEENMHKVSPTFGEEGNYRIRFEMNLEGQLFEIDFPIVVGDPSSPAAVLLGWAGALMLAVVIVRAVKIKLDRRRRPGAVAPA